MNHPKKKKKRGDANKQYQRRLRNHYSYLFLWTAM
nr:MAG TPA: hypothetical protein [Caudoviricetes sp.]